MGDGFGTDARLHDGTRIPVEVRGAGTAVLLPVRTAPYPEPEAAVMRQWGADPDLGCRLVDGVAAAGFRVIAADYEGHRMAHPAPDTLTPGNVAADLLAIADAAGASDFAYYGYSWLALSGLQLALRTDRLWALAMGGYPPIDGPYAQMLAVTRAAHTMAAAAAPVRAAVEPGDWDTVAVTSTEAQTRQFVTLYEELQSFDDDTAEVPAVPRLCFAGGDDEIVYGPGWGDVTVRIAEPLRRRRGDLASRGWAVELIPGLDHMTAMASDVVLPVLTRWLSENR